MPTTVLRLSDTLQLRLHKPGQNCSGGILLKTSDGGIWDCVRVNQWTEVRYTEENWPKKYDEIYGFNDDEDRAKIEKENADDSIFNYKNLRSPKLCGQINTRYSTLQESDYPADAFHILHSKWDPKDASLELFVSLDIETNESTLGRTEYTSMLYFFEEVVFEEECCRGAKRTKSD
jgi:hypothetical protein